ncbi:arginine/serine-rich coiled-coil protein 2 isoform X2 [Xiphias gladius]|uniref:arginine/serine-rich coiled-coil protein 2 isoform X2 n=1 Tax=Xiphias gladius TaxID=8245 RepID=UPI001A990567|nr:arginine/serine-rich coiled-coil protein 2 isoform X2 [Xiphias gladius]
MKRMQVTTTLTTWPEQAPQFITEKNTAWSHPDLPEAPNTTIHGQGHAPGTENVTENTDGVAAGAKRDNFFLKQARKRDSEKPSKSHRKTDEQQEHERLSAENGEERSRRKDRRPSKGRSLSRSHSRERRHHSRSRDKRRSRSRSRDRKKKARSRSGSKTKHRHHSRSRSKSRERKKRSEKVRRKSQSRSVNPPAFRGRNTAMDAQEALARRLERAKKLQEQKEKEMFEKQQQQQQEIAAAAPIAAAAAAAAAAASNPALNVAALLASGTQVTPQIAMAAQMAALQAKTLAETGIAVPSYYNPSAVNPMKFAEQEKKRKMLWQGKKDGDKSQTAELWEKLNFGNKDQNVKFRKLMGIKGEEDTEVSKPLNDDGLKTLQKQEEMFRNLDVQYEMARSQTHTQRGMGLGFSSSFSRGMDSI